MCSTDVATVYGAHCDRSHPHRGRSWGRTELATTTTYNSIAGVNANLTSLDVYPVEDECDAPVVMRVHGGGYAVGDKRNQIDNKVRLFNDAGWILVSVNYRLTVAGANGTAQFPDHYDDVAAAVAWVHDNIAEYGGDPAQIALLGHSAGADIVSNVVTNPTYLQPGRFGARCH